MRVPMAVARAAVLAGAVAGLTAASIQSASQPSHFAVPFGDTQETFCDKADDLAIAFSDPDPEGGFSSAESAVDGWLAGMAEIASGSTVPAELANAVRSAMAPMSDLEFPESQVVDASTTYFDMPSSTAGVLQGRLVVEKLETGHYVTAEYICASELVDSEPFDDVEPELNQ